MCVDGTAMSRIANRTGHDRLALACRRASRNAMRSPLLRIGGLGIGGGAGESASEALNRRPGRARVGVAMRNRGINAWGKTIVRE